jgi:hypothetical protein
MDKTIKLLALCIVFEIISVHTYADTSKNKIQFGIKGGINTSTTLVSLSEYHPESYAKYNIEYKYNAGFNVGMIVEFPMTKTLSIQPELVFSVKGMRDEIFTLLNSPPTSGINTWELHAISKVSLYYIELPLYFKFSFDFNNSNKLIAGIGPYLAYGISGKMNSEFVISSSDKHWIGEKDVFNENDIKFNESTWLTSMNVASWIREPYWKKTVKRFDGGFSSFIGYEIHKNWIITANYDLGLINFLNSAEAWDGKVDGSMYNRTFSITLGYKF